MIAETILDLIREYWYDIAIYAALWLVRRLYYYYRIRRKIRELENFLQFWYEVAHEVEIEGRLYIRRRKMMIIKNKHTIRRGKHE